MFCLSVLTIAALVSGAVVRAGVGSAPEAAFVSSRSEQANYYWSFWQEGSGSHNCNNGGGGSYTAKWSGGGGFVCGKGWNPGGSR